MIISTIFSDNVSVTNYKKSVWTSTLTYIKIKDQNNNKEWKCCNILPFTKHKWFQSRMMKNKIHFVICKLQWYATNKSKLQWYATNKSKLQWYTTKCYTFMLRSTTKLIANERIMLNVIFDICDDLDILGIYTWNTLYITHFLADCNNFTCTCD